jgi:hypothetical protein
MSGQTKIFGAKKTTFAGDANCATSQPLHIEEVAGNVDGFPQRRQVDMLINSTITECHTMLNSHKSRNGGIYEEFKSLNILWGFVSIVYYHHLLGTVYEQKSCQILASSRCGGIWEPERTKFNVSHCSTLKHVYTKKQKR